MDSNSAKIATRKTEQKNTLIVHCNSSKIYSVNSTKNTQKNYTVIPLRKYSNYTKSGTNELQNKIH